MTSLFDVGKSAIQAYRQSLAVTGQNIANINTEGYMRREANLQEVTASQGGITSIANQAGLGVRVANIKRSFDAFLTDSKLAANANFQRMDSYVKQLEKIETALLPSDADLGTQIGNFFRSLGDVSAAPSDLAPRVVALEQGRSLAAAFNSTFLQLDNFKRATTAQMQDAMDGINLLTKELTSVNDRILSSGQSGKSPNSFLDLRDRLVQDISAMADISVSYTDRGVANLTMGSSGAGPSLVDGNTRTQLGFIERYDRIGGLQIVLNPLSSQTPTSQLSSGIIAGLSEAYAAIDAVVNQMNQLAVQITTDLNSQHHRGITMDGLHGLDMFSAVNIVAEKNPSNPIEVEAEIIIKDPTILPQTAMTVTYSQAREVWELTGPDLVEPIVGTSVLSASGFDIRLTGPAQNGNSFTIVPGKNAAANMQFLLARPQDIAAASPDLVTAANENSSDATLEVTRVNPTIYPEKKSLADTLSNSLTAVEAKEFIHDGFVATIPAGTKSVDIGSFSKQASAKFQLSNLALQNATQLSFSRTGSSDNGLHSFNISYAAAYPNDASGKTWEDAADIAKLLNSGLFRNAASQSLSDLGMIASGNGGSLTITTAEGDFEITGSGVPSVATGVGVNTAAVSAAVNASDLQIFTREGRHLAGVAFSDAQITEFMTTGNGFDDEAVYNARYLNDVRDAYRDISMNVSFSGGMYALEIGSNGSAPVLSQGSSILPSNTTTAYNLTVDLAQGNSHNIPIDNGASAASAAAAMNAVLQNTGIRAEPETRVEFFDFQNNGVVTFDLEATNRLPVQISADVTPTNLGNLALAINKVTADTGVLAVTSPDNKRMILVSDAGEDIAISNLSNTSPAFFGRMVDDDGVALSTDSLVSFGSVVSGNTIDTARFSGGIKLLSSKSFSITTSSGTTNASQDNANGGFANVKSNATGDTKLVTFDVNTTLESGGSALDGLRAIAPNATYGITVPTSRSDVTFSANVNAHELSVISADSVNQALITELRNQAPLVSLSAGATASARQVVGYSFQRTEAVVPVDDTVTLQINGKSIAVDLNDIDGLGNAASTAADVTTAIVTAVNNANIGITASTTASAPNYGVELTADKAGDVFTVDAFRFNDLNEAVAQTQFSLQSETAARSLPADGTSVAVNLGSQIYHLKMQDGEVVVSGPEAGRVTAYFDNNSRLQIFGGGSLSGVPLTLVSDTQISGNSTGAASFGLTSATTRLAGQLITLSSGMDDLSLKFNDVDVLVSVSMAGVITTNPSTVSGLTLRWEAATATTGRLIAEYDSAQNTLGVNGPINALGFKTADREISLDGDAIKIQSTDNASFAVSATATSIAGTRIMLDNLPYEDLLVFTTGGGARNIAAAYALPVEAQDMTTYEIRSIGDTGNMIEIWDADTGHSIATRVVSGDRQTNYGSFLFTLRGRAEDGDKFTLQQDAAGTGDSRNLDLIIAMQNGNRGDAGKMGFQEMFGSMIAGVGSSLQSGKIAAQVQEENLMAAKEAEAEFSGVNLDTEAAALLEYQQAYQASARILSTARELFQSLMEVV